MSNIEKLFGEISNGIALSKMKIDGCPLGVYYGISEDGNLRFALLTENPPTIIDSTAYLKVSQWAESVNVYWTSFDLLTLSAKQVFMVLCDNLIDAAVGCQSEEIAMREIKNRFTTWKKLFKNSSSGMTEELYKGLFGELYFLKNWMIEHYTADIAVNSWSGPDKTAKDYSVGMDWFEVKTVSTNAETVKISSLTQLDSESDGKLVLVKTEKMSKEYDNGECSVDQLISFILRRIKNEALKDSFIEKIVQYGYNIDANDVDTNKYRVSKMNFYLVDNVFPKITVRDVPHCEIAKVQYELSVSAIDKYLEGEK